MASLSVAIIFFLSLESGFFFLTKEKCYFLVEDDKRVSKRGSSIGQP